MSKRKNPHNRSSLPNNRPESKEKGVENRALVEQDPPVIRAAGPLATGQRTDSRTARQGRSQTSYSYSYSYSAKQYSQSSL